MAGNAVIVAASKGASAGYGVAASTALSGLASAGIGFAIAGITLVMSLLAAHDARMKLAKEENGALAQALTAFDGDLKTIFDAANKGDITPGVAAQACEDVHNWFWAWIMPFQQGATKGPTQVFPNPGAPNNAAVGGIYYEATDGANCHCDSEGVGTPCTAACCIGCAAFDPCLSNAYVWFSRGKAFTLAVPVVVANKYGLPQRATYNLTFTPPKKENPEAEVTINAKTGVVTVGAPPSSTDAVIASGVVAIGAAPDTGSDVIQHTASGTDVNTTSVSVLSQIPGGITTVLLAGLAAVILFAMPARRMA